MTRSCFANLPSPQRYVTCLTPQEKGALLSAVYTYKGWRVGRQAAAMLLPLGLVACNEDFLTAYGTAVRSSILDELGR